MQRRSEETRIHILEAALKQFAVFGYDAASVGDICSDAGVSKGAFYHHFSSKQAIFLALLGNWLKMIDNAMEDLRQPTVPKTFLRMTEMLPLILATAEDRLPMILEFWLQASRDETVWQATIAPYHHYRDHFAKLIEDGIAEGSLNPTDSEEAAHVVVSLALGLLLQGAIDPHGANWQKVADQSMHILMDGLAKK